MPLKLCPAVSADADRISEIHLAAFASNSMLLAQFPTPDVRRELQESIRLKALADIDDPKITVLVVRETPPASDVPIVTGAEAASSYECRVPGQCSRQEAQEGQVIAFAKWSHPINRDEEYEETAWIWPPGTNMKILESWGRAAEEGQEQAMGRDPCYRLTFIGTDPAHERRGAASMMVRWGIEQCNRDCIPGYLESTLDAAPFYLKIGFEASGKISLQYPVGDRGHYGVYEEIVFVYRPGSNNQ
ncbi:putative GNAT family acetyltransferase [Xylaria sp. FL0933]|nr:putative GNAT family acetyltransferase [Xylaria sp. FL0933]